MITFLLKIVYSTQKIIRGKTMTALILLTVFAVGCLYLWKITKSSYWESRGIPSLKPVVPLFGNMYDLLMLRSLSDIAERIYKKTKTQPYVGIYAFKTPVLFVNDLDLISNILIKDFHSFENRGFHSNPEDSLSKNLIHQNGDEWRYFRSKLNPCFSMNRVKAMLPTMIKKSALLIERIEKEQSVKGFDEVWETSLRYSTDVVTPCTMGVEANSLIDQKSQFREAGEHMLGLHFIYHVFVGSFFPNLHRRLGISVAKEKVKRFFHLVLEQTLEHRKQNKSVRKDVLQTLIDIKEEYDPTYKDKNQPEVDENDIIAQSFIFFLAGFESPGNVLACTLHEIASNPEIQTSLVQEITTVLQKFDNNITFDALQDMKYMRQVVSEGMRKYAPLTLIFRRCTKDYPLPGSTTSLEKNTVVLIPVRSIHNDPKYYPNPHVFDPARFSEENSADRHVAAYMPFGNGPRICPAVLYSHLKIRTALVFILRHFHVSLAPGAPPSLRPSSLSFLYSPSRGVPLVFTKRIPIH